MSNNQTLPPNIADLWPRAERLIEAMAERSDADLADSAFGSEARAILADIPEPVDPDLVEARRLAAADYHKSGLDRASILAGRCDHWYSVSFLRRGIKRGRELQRAAKPSGDTSKADLVAAREYLRTIGCYDAPEVDDGLYDTCTHVEGFLAGAKHGRGE